MSTKVQKLPALGKSTIAAPAPTFTKKQAPASSGGGGMSGQTALAGASFATALFGAYAAIQQGKIEAAQYGMQADAFAGNAEITRFAASLERLKARDAKFRGQLALRELGTVVNQTIGAQRSAFAGQGVDVNQGSAADVQADTQYQATMDRVTLENNITREAWGYEMQAMSAEIEAMGLDNQAANARANASQARRAGRTNAWNTIAGGAMNAAMIGMM